MYIVRDANNEIVAISTQYSDAQAFLSGAEIDKVNYTIEDTLETEKLEQKFLEIQDGIGEGQSW